MSTFQTLLDWMPLDWMPLDWMPLDWILPWGSPALLILTIFVLVRTDAADDTY